MINNANNNRRTAYLVTENGGVYQGQSFGYVPEDGEPLIIGELVFTTAANYMETLNDSRYFGQIVVQSFPLSGCYGTVTADFENINPMLSAYIVRNYCQEPSNFRSEGPLDVFLCKNKIPAVCGIDTRALIRRLRDFGSENAAVTFSEPDVESVKKLLADYKVKDAVKATAPNKMRNYAADNGNADYRVALWNFGAKGEIIESLCKRGCSVTEIPSNYSAADILALNPSGIVLSDGAGDPAENTDIIESIKKLIDSGIPVFGIGLGHLMASIAAGAKTVKLHHGKHGSNQPVRVCGTNKVFITAQNCGYAVDKSSLPEEAAVTFVNANDGSVEGIEYKNIFTLQFAPETCGGVHDEEYLISRFITMMNMRGGKNNA